jgi:hypothetical protein
MQQKSMDNNLSKKHHLFLAHSFSTIVANNLIIE